jgi:hypothetical protein
MAKRNTNGGTAADNMPAGMKPEDTCLELYRRFAADPEALLLQAGRE